ncbi:MFS transporter [Phreatobacter stygius]|uniref:MFS transporter n=1 Tax=Phreatobacter stygius TaxID=1940610 RepID=A0A4D7B8S3_9HYPH|nr:MFS transporter [Phreatobacter stygius]QCI67243.1 MFS transporter [Phreatobacter stygius]
MRIETEAAVDSGGIGGGAATHTPATTGGEAAALSRTVALLFAVASGLAVANVYFAHPLLDRMAEDFAISHGAIGLVMTMTQVGYGLGLLLIVPLGDLLDRRRLIVGQSVASAAVLLVVATASNATVFFAALAVMGLLAVVTQVLVAFAAGLARPDERGQVVGVVTSGIVIGILLARTVSGTLADLAGWRSVYVVSAGLTLAIALVLARVLPAETRTPAATSYVRLIGSVFTLFAEMPVLRIRATIAMLIFAAIVTLLTPLVLPLSAPPFSLSHTQIGLFGLAGAAGALGASRAGAWADRGFAQRVSCFGLALMLAAWLPIGLMHWSLWGPIIGVVIIDFGLQAVHVTNQAMIYAERPEAQSRLTAGYMIFYSIGSALGSIASTLTYASAGWTGVSILGAAISATALVFWAATRHVGAKSE